MKLSSLLSLLSSLCFLFYSIQCLVTEHMQTEFARYGVPQLRLLTAVLQLLGGIGLLAGFYWRPAQVISSGGLALMMLAALAVRVRIGDGVFQSLPAFGLMVVNGYIFFASLR